MKTTKLYVELAQRIAQLSNCIASNNSEWQRKTEIRLEYLAKQYLPSGSGFDCGTKLDIDACLRDPSKIVLQTSFHHMDDNGMYDGWTEHTIIVKPSLARGFTLSISGRNRNAIKDYIHETFSFALDSEEWSIREEYLRLVETHPEIKIESQWKDQCTQAWFCDGKEFQSYIPAMEHAVNSVKR